MYISGFVVAVPEGNKGAYRDVAEQFWEVAKDYGALELVEAWEADVPEGKQTDFRRAVDLKEGEKVVFSWVIWPDKETADASQDKMMSDERMEAPSDSPPFDGKRMIYGGFEPLVVRGR